MPGVTPRSTHRKNNETNTGIPLWLSLFILVVALCVGAAASILTGTISLVMLGIIVLTALVLAAVAEPRSLFLLTALTPLVVTFGLCATAWVLVGASFDLSKTEILTVMYPLLQHFPTLAASLVGMSIIGIIRVLLLRRRANTQSSRTQARRQEEKHASEQAQKESLRFRRGRGHDDADALSVEEIARRSERRRGSKGQQRPRPPEREPHTSAAATSAECQ